MLRPKLAAAALDDVFDGSERELAGFLTAAMRDTTDEVKEAFRDQVRAAGLGDRLPNAIRGIVYPRSRDSLEPTGWIYAQPSKDGRGAAAIVESYADGAFIVARAGRRWLAVPTDDCPRARGGRALSPEEVEDRFGRRLVFIDPADKHFKTPSVRRRGVAYLVMKDVVVRKSSQTWRKPTANELAGKTRNPRPLQAVIMFTLVRGVKKPKSLDLSAPAALAEERFPANLDKHWR